MTTRHPGRRGGGPGRPRDPKADAAILKAALELFIERGVDGTSLEQIAKQAGVARLTLYRRWKSKEELLAQAIESARHEIRDPIVEDIGDRSLQDWVEQALPAAVETFTNPAFQAMIAQIMGSAVRYPTLMATYWEHYMLPRRRIFSAVFDRAIQDGILPEGTDIDILIDTIVGAIVFRVLQPGPFDAAEARRYLETLCRQTGLFGS